MQDLLVVHGSFERMGGAQRDLISALPALGEGFAVVRLTTLHATKEVRDAGAAAGVTLIAPAEAVALAAGGLAEVTARASRMAAAAWRTLWLDGASGLAAAGEACHAVHAVGGALGTVEFLTLFPKGKPVHYHCLEPPRGLYEDVLHQGLDGSRRRPAWMTSALLWRQRRRDRGQVRRFLQQRGVSISGNSVPCAAQVAVVYDLEGRTGRHGEPPPRTAGGRPRYASALHHAVDLVDWPAEPDKAEHGAAATLPELPASYALTIGAATRVKGTLEALQVLAGSGLGLVLVGRAGPEELELLSLESSALEVPFVHATDLSWHALRALMRGATAVVSLAHQEPFGLTPVEAMALGTPALMVDAGGFQDTVVDGETGRLLPRPGRPGDATDPAQQAWTKAITEAADPDTRAHWATAGRTRVEAHFTKQAHVAGLIELLEEAAQVAPQRPMSPAATSEEG